MINPTGKKLEKLLFGIFDDAIEGIDRYNHNGSLWLIFTDEMRWVVEYTKEQTLWYNYYFFRNEMELVGLNCVENKDLIQKWFEYRFIKPEVVEDTIQNGVKYTATTSTQHSGAVEDTIQNGVKHTYKVERPITTRVEDTIQNGVKETKTVDDSNLEENAVEQLYRHLCVDDTVQNGVKDTKEMNHDRHSYHGYFKLENDIPTHIPMAQVQDVVQDGVKHCEDGDWLNGDERFEDVIQNGVKEMQPLPAQDGNRDWGLYYQRQEDRTKPHAEYVREVIEEYHHRRREVVITMNDGVKEIHDDCSNNVGRVGGVIRIGEKLN